MRVKVIYKQNSEYCCGKCSDAENHFLSDSRRQPVVINRVISGGQIGIDIAALRAAKSVGIKTGGNIPIGFRTLAGLKPGYAWMYKMVECTGIGYKQRTWKNVEESDATIRLATNYDTPGEQCTLNAIRHYGRLHLDVCMIPWWEGVEGRVEYRLSPIEVAYWLVVNNVKTLNVAGNANIELEEPVERYLKMVFNLLLYKDIK